MASGTATLETALLGTPEVIVYRIGRATWLLGKLLLRVRTFGLVNIILGEEVVPELYQDRMTPTNVADVTVKLMDDVWVQSEIRGNYEKLRRQLGTGLETLAAIHRVDLEKYDLSRLPRSAAGEKLLAQELRTFGSIFKPDLRREIDPIVLEAWNLLEATVPTDAEPALCWGDSRVGNVIFRDSRPAAILDWEMANISDPRTDLAWWFWIDRCNSEGLGLERLAGLPSAQQVFEQWHAHTGRSINGIAGFELFAVVRYAFILELKFIAMREANSELGNIPNFTIQFIPDLISAVRDGASGS